VLAADSSRVTLFSQIVFAPHGMSTEKTIFTHILTTHGRDVKMTGSHIIPAGACGSTWPLPNIYASSFTVGNCIIAVSGTEKVSAVEMAQGQGLYTIITKEVCGCQRCHRLSFRALSHDGQLFLQYSPFRLCVCSRTFDNPVGSLCL
jgi:hypothetical protein